MEWISTDGCRYNAQQKNNFMKLLVFDRNLVIPTKYITAAKSLLDLMFGPGRPALQ